MDVLVIGGTRNLGPLIVDRLLAAGDRVTVFNRGITPGTLPPEVERITGDRTVRAQLAAAVGGRDFDAVVDTTLYDGAEARAALEIFRGRVGHYVFLSSGQVYLVRDPVPARPFAEADYDGAVQPAPDRGTREHDGWTYGVLKRQAEDAFAEAFASSSGLAFTSLRLPMVHSERDHYGRIHGYLLRLLDGGPILVPQGPDLPVRHVYGPDVARAVETVLRAGSGKGHAYNVAQDETLSLEEFLAMLGRAAGREVRTLRLPRETLEDQDLVPASSPFSGRWMSSLDNARGKAELGLTYTPFPEYLARLVEHYTTADVPPPAGYDRREMELHVAAHETGADA
ncbi:MAG: NAD-dependent epimerase/dehydratase [Gemmatimonadetes bacterium]|nr:NAD-dependent epimerase/dehydratase [Gemmatimonadota bacterium]